MAYALALAMLCGVLPSNAAISSAATQKSVSLTSLGRQGSVSIGAKSKTGTWWKMNLGGKEAFCINLGYTCHSGNTYEMTETHNWDQDTGGEKNGYYAKVIRWYVLNAKRSNKGFIMSQALIWSIQEGRNSESQLKDIIKQVKNNTGYYSSKTVNEVYEAIFKPSGAWSTSITFWQKTGNRKSYQKLMTVDAEKDIPHDFNPKETSTSAYYRQRITVMKQDEDGQGLGGIQFTLDAHNLDDLYSFSMTDRNGTTSENADEDNDTSFSLTGYTRDSGRIAYRMTYRLASMGYYYYTDAELAKMTAEEKKAAKKYLTDEMDLDAGVDFGTNMTKAEADALANKEISDLKNEISNTYTLTENNTGDNKNIILDPEFAKGVNITLTKSNSWYKNSDGVWPDTLEAVSSDYALAYRTGVTNKYKKATVNVVKIDKYSSDKKAHGDANLDGAQFQLYADENCTTLATVYDGAGNKKTAGTYSVKAGKIMTDYLRSGITYYLKEVKAPLGYTLSNTVLPINVDASQVTAEYTSNLATVEYGNQPILGKVAIQKHYFDGETGELSAEANATFQIYLTSKGSYDACDNYERAIIKTDQNGYAVTPDLYYGKYTVHQVDSGDVDAILVKDFSVEVTESGKVYTYPLNNTLFKAYLRILKVDKNTKKQVLKAGTTYQIYKMTKDGEELVEQSYSDGNKVVKVNKFVTDESGEVMTVKPLRSATYRIYETDSASGLHITEKYIEVTINSKADNYSSIVDESGNTHIVVSMTYANDETYGKLSIAKTGDVLTGWDTEHNQFIYEERGMTGAEFEIYADGDIVTQDNQGTTWFKDGEKAATIVTGKSAEFTSDCNGICSQSVDSSGVVHITLPLGRYKVKEVKTLYGYVFPEKNEWDIEFTWNNSKDEYVINSTSDTDKDGVLNIRNTLAKPEIQLLKEDEDSKEAIMGAVFGIYSSNDIYNVDGKKIVDAGTMLTTITSTEDGIAKCDMSMPLKDEAYPVTGSAVSGEAVSLNSGNYYLKEISVPDSYYLDETQIPIHLEYKDAKTKVISVKCVKTNKQTTNEIDKLELVGSKELPGCELEITDADGKKIVSWTSGDKESLKVYITEEDGYMNFKTIFDEKGNLHIGGLLHDKEYTLTETRPVDGYVTADAVTYIVKYDIVEDGSVHSIVAVKDAEGNYADRTDDKTVMYDEQTKIKVVKLDDVTGQGLPGAKIKVTDRNGKEVLSFVSTEDGTDLTGVLNVGETYTFTEISAPKGYKLAKAVHYTVKDTSKVQSISIIDKRIPKITPPVPQTGENTPVVAFLVGFIVSFASAFLLIRKKKA